MNICPTHQTRNLQPISSEILPDCLPIRPSLVDGSLDGALGVVLTLENKQVGDQMRSSISAVEQCHKKMTALVEEKQKQLEERIESKKSSGFWGLLSGIFKGIALALTGIASVLSGGIAIVGAGLVGAATILGNALKSQFGKWLSMGLSVVGSLIGMGSGLGNLLKISTSAATSAAQNGSTVANATKLALQSGSIASTGMSSISGGVANYFDAKTLHTDANLLRLHAQTTTSEMELDRERSALKDTLDRGSRIRGMTIETLNRSHRATDDLLQKH